MEEDLREPRLFEHPGKIPAKLSTALSAAGLFMTIVMPFAITLITGVKEKIVVIACLSVFQIFLALQVVSREAALESVIEFSGMEDERSFERRKIAHDAVLLSIISFLMMMASVGGILSGYFPKTAINDNYASEVILAFLGLSVLLIKNRKVLLMAILLESPIFVFFGYMGWIDVIAIALWQTMFSTIVLNLTLEIQGRELVAMARASTAEKALADAET